MFAILLWPITVRLSFLFSWNIYVLHVRNILGIFFTFILIPKYIINENLNLKLYVSVYHWVPAPVLPWQLPKNYSTSVNLVVLSYENE